jgi:hypothetical protein
MAQPAKHEPPRAVSVTPAGFARDAGRSHGDPRSENALVHGENLDAMTRLARAGFARPSAASTSIRRSTPDGASPSTTTRSRPERGAR